MGCRWGYFLIVRIIQIVAFTGINKATPWVDLHNVFHVGPFEELFGGAANEPAAQKSHIAHPDQFAVLAAEVEDRQDVRVGEGRHGTDFTFEDLEERDVDRSTYKLTGEEKLDGAVAWKIESTPKAEARSQYTRIELWVRKDTYSFVQADCFAKDKLVRRIRYTDLEKVQNIWTARTLEVHDIERDSRTVMKLEKLQYNIPLAAENFTLQALRREQ